MTNKRSKIKLNKNPNERIAKIIMSNLSHKRTTTNPSANVVVTIENNSNKIDLKPENNNIITITREGKEVMSEAPVVSEEGEAVEEITIVRITVQRL